MNNDLKGKTTYFSFNNIGNSNDILYNIITDNYNELIKLVTRDNVNKVIDNKNGYTPLHYAVKMNNDQMIKLFLSLDAEPSIKTKDGKDAFDIGLKYQNKYLFDLELKDRDITISSQSKTIQNISAKLTDMENNNKYIIKQLDDANMKSTILKNENKDLKTEISKANETIKSKIETIKSVNNDLSIKNKSYQTLLNTYTDLKASHIKLENDYDILNNQHKSLKRKSEEDETAYTGLLNSIKKRK